MLKVGTIKTKRGAKIILNKFSPHNIPFLEVISLCTLNRPKTIIQENSKLEKNKQIHICEWLTQFTQEFLSK